MLIPISGTSPEVDPTGWVAPNAVLAGDVRLGAQASAWYAAVVRGDCGSIRIGARTNIQDGSVLHTDPGMELLVGDGVTVGHGALLHGCRIEDNVLVGMGAIVMNGVIVGSDSIIAAGALLPEGVVIPPGSLVVGAPGKVRRETSDDERSLIRLSADEYVKLALLHSA
jgi:carbonic anhydrase/acetyltransferase-like protein (isoleucine patch superfamily)